MRANDQGSRRMTITRVLSVIGVMLIYALCFALIKAGLAFAPPLRFGALRALIGGVALLGVVVVRRVLSLPKHREPILPTRAHWPALLLLAFTSTTLTFGAMFLSPGRTGAGIASVLGNTQPLMTLALAGLFLGESLTPAKLIALLLGLSGAVLALAASGGQPPAT